MQKFDHEKLDVYQVAIKFVVLSNEVIEILPRGKGYIVDQLQRAATSIPLNIAEGAGEFSPGWSFRLSYTARPCIRGEKKRFYRIAKRSATECAAIMDVCLCLQLIDKEMLYNSSQLLIRIVAMLIKMIRKNVSSGTGTGTHTGTKDPVLRV